MMPQEGPGPRKGWVLAAVAALLLAALGAWFGHAQGQRTAGHDAAREATAQRTLTAELERVEAENKRLHARVAELEMARRLDRDAYGQVERTLGDLQSQLARQSDDLAFYRSIVSPADGIQGLRIQRFEVLTGAKPGEVVLKLTLVQAMRHESIVSGLAQITLNGLRDGVPAKYTVGELLGRPRAQLPFSFRYFQSVEQAVVLPEGFEPYTTDVRLQSSKLPRPVQQVFPWEPPATAAL
jgi:hypothetical protein